MSFNSKNDLSVDSIVIINVKYKSIIEYTSEILLEIVQLSSKSKLPSWNIEF